MLNLSDWDKKKEPPQDPQPQDPPPTKPPNPPDHIGK